jgi:hypothetical protein
MRLRPRSAALCLAALPAALALCAAGQPPRPAAVPEEVLARFQVDEGLLLLPVEVKGKRLQFLLDTGATHSVYDSSLTDLLGEPLGSEQASTALGPLTVRKFKAPDARAGALSLRTDSPVVAVDLQRVRDVTGEEIYGFVGMDVLHQQVFRFDPDRGEVVFLRSAGPGAGIQVPLVVADGFPCVEVLVWGLGAAERFVVDTGYAGPDSGSLRADSYGALLRQGRLRPIGEGNFTTLGPTKSLRFGRVQEFSLAGARHQDLIFSESADNLLGMTFWSRYVVTFDFPHLALFLTEGKGFNQPDVSDMSGLSLIRSRGKTVVHSVSKGSPAEAATIRPQDRLVRVDGQAADGIRLMALRKRFRSEGKTVRLVVSQDAKEREVELALRDWHRVSPGAAGEGK